MIQLKWKSVKSRFLDRAHVMRRIGAAKARALTRGGGRIRTIAQRSMRYRVKGSSAPGQPPFAHKRTGALLRKLLFFIYDEQSESVVVGPLVSRSGEAPRLNEFGGTTKRVKRRKSGTQTVIARYPARPFMEPALRKVEPSLPKDWTNSVIGP